MSKFLDNVFCEYVITNHLVTEAVVAQIQQRANVVTIREAMMSLGYISLEKYKGIFASLQSTKSPDSLKSSEHDKKFLDYGIQKGWLTLEDVNQCKEFFFLSAFSMRELLLISNKIPYEMYRDIMSALMPLENKPVSNLEKSVVSETIVDGSLRKEKTEDPSQISIVEESATAETLIDINPLDDGFGKPSLAETFRASPSEIPLPQQPSEKANKSPKENKEDASAETLIDQEIHIGGKGITLGKKPESEPEREPASDNIAAEHIKGATTKVDKDGVKMLLPPEAEKETKPGKEAEDTVDLNYVEALREPAPVPVLTPSKSVAKKAATSQPLTKSAASSSKMTASPSKGSPSKAIKSTAAEKVAVTNEGGYTVPAVLIETLVKEISREVNLQTQQASHSIGQSLKGYKILLGFTIFVSTFVLIFTGSIEFQRAQELKTIRNEKDKEMQQLLDEKKSLSQAKQTLESEREKQKQEAKSLEDQLALFRSEKDRMQKEVESLQQNTSSEKEKWSQQLQALKLETDRYQKELLKSYERLLEFNYRQKRYADARESFEKVLPVIEGRPKEEATLCYAYGSLVFQALEDHDKAAQYAKKSWETMGKKNGEVLLLLAEYFEKKKLGKGYAEALKMLQQALLPNFSSLWKVHLKMGDIYYLQAKYISARESWETALKLNPSLQNEVKAKLAKLPKN